MTELRNMKLWQREQYLRANGLQPVEPQYAIAWEDPGDLEAPVKVMTPSPMWLAMALHGDVLPPVDVYHRLATDDKGRITNGHILHETPPISAMSEEEAMEYLLQKDVPQVVWAGAEGNRRRFVICKRSLIPRERRFRNAWELKEAA